jgi:SSS family solute:Na+ symporter
MGRAATIVAIAVSLMSSYINFLFSDLMEHVQLIFSVFGAPFFAIFLLGMSTRRANERGAIAGFLSGTAVALLHLFALGRGWVHYGSLMSANFYAAIYAFCTSAAVGLLVSLPGSDMRTQRGELHMRLTVRGIPPLLWILSALLLCACVGLNVMWR